MQYTDSELKAFSQQNDIDFTDIGKTSSIKTNIFILSVNFINLKTYLSKLKALVVKEKLSLTLDLLATEENQVINGVTYNVHKVDDLNFVITRVTDSPLWITDNLIVQIKDVLGVINNTAIISTINNSVAITFQNIIFNTNKIFMV